MSNVVKGKWGNWKGKITLNTNPEPDKHLTIKQQRKKLKKIERN